MVSEARMLTPYQKNLPVADATLTFEYRLIGLYFFSKLMNSADRYFSLEPWTIMHPN